MQISRRKLLARGIAGAAVVALGAKPVFAVADRDAELRRSWENCKPKCTPREGLLTAFNDTEERERNARIKLTRDMNFYVRPDGADVNDGLANNSAHAFKTIHGGYSYLRRNVDCAGYTVALHVADGIYNERVIIEGSLVGQAGAGGFGIIGGPGAILDANSSRPSFNIQGSGSAATILGGITIQNSGPGGALRVADSAYGQVGNITWGVAGNTHIGCDLASHIYIFEDYTITGNAPIHTLVTANSSLEVYKRTVTASGTRAFTTFVECYDGGVIETSGNRYSGTFKGKRYQCYNAGGINTFGSGMNYFPGDSAGSVDAATCSWYA